VRVTELDSSMYPDAITGTPTESHATRSQGTLHLSTIYRDLEEEALLRRKSDFTSEELAWYAAGGFIWERAFSMAFRDSVVNGGQDLVRPDEFELDGIVGSPDVIRVSDWTLIELKARWMSARKLDQLEKYFWVELLQVRGYLKMIGATNCELWIWFVCGDWRPPVPCVRGLALDFSQQEIDEAWGVVLAHARRKGWL